ncbi:DCC1-like thiol-disulfide oxidoreductase family protein [Bradyrhizobium sp. HKCCYLS2038]|uniref:DCC1-like thiol-disulfide oxidoreductase family protein n=1 Tax=unclassified Bradyrhizobium TaxID=2631580 RepID=UPI003EB84926
MAPERGKSTVYFYGSCPLCRAGIGYYSRTDEAGALCFIDVSQARAEVPDGLTQREAMQLRRVCKAPPSGGVGPTVGRRVLS